MHNVIPRVLENKTKDKKEVIVFLGGTKHGDVIQLNSSAENSFSKLDVVYSNGNEEYGLLMLKSDGKMYLYYQLLIKNQMLYDV